MMEHNTMELVIRDGIRFLESLTRHYGQEEGLRIWDSVGEIVGAEVKGKIFFAMLTGEIPTRVGFLQGTIPANGGVVTAIRAIRSATGLGLKEAKDRYDESGEQRTYIECLTPEHAHEFIRAIRSIGGVV